MRSKIWPVALIFGLLFVGCASQKPAVSSRVVPYRSLASLKTPLSDWGLQPGDRLDIRLASAPELNTVAIVEPDGYIDLPEVGRVRVAGLSVDRVKRILEIRYGTILRDPDLTIQVQRAVPEGVYVLGEVAHPGKVLYSGDLTLSRALAMVGGPTPTAKLSAVRLFRPVGAGTVRRFEVNVKAVLEAEPGYTDLLLSPGDVIVVPPSAIARIEQFVDRYIDGLLPLATITAFAWVYRIVVRGY